MYTREIAVMKRLLYAQRYDKNALNICDFKYSHVMCVLLNN